MDLECHARSMVRRKVEAVELKTNPKGGYTFELGAFSYDLHFEDGAWFLDQFQRRVERDFVGSFQFESLAEGVHFAFDEKSLSPVESSSE